MQITRIKSNVTFTGRPYPIHTTKLNEHPYPKKDTFYYPGYPGMLPEDKNPFGGILHNLNVIA